MPFAEKENACTNYNECLRFRPRQFTQAYNVRIADETDLCGFDIGWYSSLSLPLLPEPYINKLIKEDRPSLLLPWLVVGSIRYVLVNLISFLVGTYVCSLQRGVHLVCLDFVLYEVIEYGPSVYAWFAVLCYYRYLNYQEIKEQNAKEELQINRKRVKSLSVSYWDQDPECLIRNIITSDCRVCMKIQSFIEELKSGSSLELSPSRSFHTVSIFGEKENRLSIFDAFDDSTLSLQERVAKILEISKDDIQRAKTRNGRTLDFLSSVTLEKDLKHLDDPHVTKPRVQSVLMLEKLVRKDLTTTSSPSLIEEIDPNTLTLKACICMLRKFGNKNSNHIIANESEIASVDLEEENQTHLPETKTRSDKSNSLRIPKETTCSANKARKSATLQANSLTVENDKKQDPKNVEATNKPRSPSLGFRKIVQDVVRSIEMREKKENNFTGQVSSISKHLLSLPTQGISKKLDIFKNFVHNK